ncbi:MAG: hypothetical protein K0Q83_2631 [Deltaproteobacteria bacterium]|nr:hypothetical protein [Deltaproteobacteria bacterium]
MLCRAQEGDGMQPEQPVIVKRDCVVLMIPSGEKLTLASGSTVAIRPGFFGE